jgi:hypothetical protein
MCLRLDLYMSHVLLLCVSVIFFLTCDMYKSSLRHIHDPVLSSLKMEGIRLLLFIYSSFFCFLTASMSISAILVTRCICHTCNTIRVYHDTILTCATVDSFCSLFPYPFPPQAALPHMCLCNAYEG